LDIINFINSSLVDASSQLGIDGIVIIESPSIDMDKNINVLSMRYLDTQQWKQKTCDSTMGNQISSFMVTQREGMATMPEDLMSSDFDDLVFDKKSLATIDKINNIQQLSQLTKTKCL